MNDKSGEYEDKAEIDWENRILCSDESCIGVVGPDGRCKECGRPFEGGGALPTSAEPVEEVHEPAAVAPAPAAPDGAADETAAQAGDDSWENRTLCSDESCIGVIGPDGRCRECGKPYEG